MHRDTLLNSLNGKRKNWRATVLKTVPKLSQRDPFVLTWRNTARQASSVRRAPDHEAVFAIDRLCRKMRATASSWPMMMMVVTSNVTSARNSLGSPIVNSCSGG